MAKILIIDDDQQICGVVGEFLRQQGFEVAVASNGEQGLKTAATLLPDLILCDLDMPGLDGQDVVTALRRDVRQGEIPVIFLSACTERDQIRKSMNLGGDDFITKPAQLPEILEAVNARLNRQHKQQQKLDQQLESAAQIFVGIIHDLNKTGPQVRWLLDTTTEMAGQQNTILQRVRRSLAAGASNAAKPPAALLIKNNNRKEYLRLSEVKALLACGEYADIFWGKDQHILFRKPLKQWEAELPQDQFVRVHRQAIVNLAFLDFVDKDATGKPQIHLRDFKKVIPVSQRETPRFNSCLRAFQAAAGLRTTRVGGAAPPGSP